MPAYRKPTELLALGGAFEKNPQRRCPIRSKSPHPISDPPGHLVPDEAAAWYEFVHYAPTGVLTSGNRWILEVAARLVARSRRQGLTGAERGHLRACPSELGATPASRGWVSAAGPPRRPRATHGIRRHRPRPSRS